MSEPGGELSQYEKLSALTPKKTPYAILAGFVLIGPLLILINWLAPNEALEDMNNKKEKAEEEAPAEVLPAGEDVEEL